MTKNINSRECSSSSRAGAEGPPSRGVVDPATAADENPNRRSQEEDWRICVHEASHATIQRLLSAKPIGGVTVQEGPDFEGLCWSEGHDKERTFASGKTDEQNDAVIRVIADTMPQRGEVALDASRNVVAGALEHAIEAVAGVEGERLFLSGPPSQQDGDDRLARSLASLICSPGSIGPFIAFCCAEARELLKQHEHVVLEIAAELSSKRELSGSDVDACIALAVAKRSVAEEQERRKTMRRIVDQAAKSAALFTPVKTRRDY